MISPFKLNATLGRDYNADLDDTLRTKKALQKIGLFETPSYGMTEFPDEPLFKGIEKFQDQYNLQKDGIMKPDGETAAKLGRVLAENENRKTYPVPNALSLTAEVGFGRANKPHDIFSLSRALAWAGYPHGSERSTTDNSPQVDGLSDAIKQFQKTAGLKVDGWTRPHGETEDALNHSLQPKIEASKAAANARSELTDSTGTLNSQTGDQQAVAQAAIPAIVYRVAEFFGMAVMAAWAWWQSMTSSEQEKIKKQVSGQRTDNDGGDNDQCEYLHYEVDIPKCRAIERARGKQAAQRCYTTANERYAACLKGVPLDRLPPLDTWNN